MKEIAGKLETDNYRLYSNSRLNEAWILYDIALIIINQFKNFYHVYKFFLLKKFVNMIKIHELINNNNKYIFL